MPPALLSTLTRLVAEPTVSPHPTVQVAAHLAERAEACGFRVTTFDVAPGRANLIARAGPAGTDGLALSGHMDVVPVDGQDWSSDPWKVSERGGKLYGRGTADMKGFLAAATVAVEQLPLDRLRRELVLVWTADEEIGCVGSRKLAQDHLAGTAPLASPGERALPSATLIGEPTDWRICRLHPGHTTLELVATGAPAHSSRPGLGVNALAIITHALSGLFELARALESERAFEGDLPSPFAIVNPACIHGGSAVNIVPERCVLAVGVRALPGQTEQDVLDRVRTALGPAQRAARALGGTLELVQGRHAPPLLTPAGTDLEALLAPHAADPRATGAPFATDGGNLAALGSDCLVFGPGSIDVAHKPDEYVPAADLVRAVDVVSALVRARCIEVDT